jgi:hypothetical protein
MAQTMRGDRGIFALRGDNQREPTNANQEKSPGQTARG